MNRQAVLLGGVILVIVLVVVLGVWLRGDEPASGAPVSVAPVTTGQREQSVQVPASTAVASLPSREDVPLPAQPDASQVDAVESLSQSRLQGDARAPAVVRSSERVPPTAAELADPDAYQRYEARQNERLYRGYVKAADSEIPKLQEQIAKGRSEGLTPEQIAEGEEKLRRIESMRNQLMSDHPELNKPASP